MLARKEAGILNYDTELLRDYYKIKVRDGANFSVSLSEIELECKDNSDNLKFDLVIRKYMEDGTEILPKSLKPEMDFPPLQNHAQHQPYHNK